MKQPTGERGGATVELVILTPALLLLLIVVVAGSRLVSTRGDLDGAAREAARAGSLAASPAAAQTAAAYAVRTALLERHLHCPAPKVDVDVTRFAPGGTVAVSVSCAVDLADLGLPGLPGERTIQSRAVAPIDPLAVHR
jgi:Flp pilus assembly protein TadG